jgi:hypothetical protein
MPVCGMLSCIAAPLCHVVRLSAWFPRGRGGAVEEREVEEGAIADWEV